MLSQIPLYSRGRPLKNLIADYKSKGLSILQKQNSVYDIDCYNIDELPLEASTLYRAIIRKWYFSEIGFETDEEFIYRFGAVFWKYFNYYRKYASMVEGYQKDTETLTIAGENTRNTESTERPNLTNTLEIKKTGNIQYEKGVKTESTQNTQNTGNKLTRSTPNEDMSVVGEATNVVEDSGMNIDVFNTTDTHTEKQTGTNTKTGNETLSVDTTNERSKLTTSNLLDYRQLLDVIERFVYKFENLFMEVL